MELSEKAKSRAQQRLMGSVLNAKRTGKASTPEVAKLALTMKTSDVKDFASTKHKNLPEKKKVSEGKCDDCNCEGCGQNPCIECGENHHKLKKVTEGSEHTQWSASIMLPSKRRKFVVVSCPSRDRKDAIQIIKALYGTDDIKQLNRIGIRVENVNEEKSYSYWQKAAREAHDRVTKAKAEKNKQNSEAARKVAREKGIPFSDKKGKGHIRSGKKVYG